MIRVPRFEQGMLIRSRAPLRLGLGGGGTDLSPYCDRYGGVVLNCTIDRYAYAFIEPRNDDKVAFQAHDLSIGELHEACSVLPISQGLKLHRGVHNRIVAQFNNRKPLAVTISTTVDAPAGSGLGSSSALVVALVEAYRTFLGLPLGRYDVAQLAYEIERKDLKLAGGKQDQYAAAFGGINFIEFLSDDRVIVNPLRLDEGIMNEFETSLIACFSGISRDSDMIISEQIRGVQQNEQTAIEALHQLKEDAVLMKHELLTGNVPGMAELMKKSWSTKKLTAHAISTKNIESLLDIAFREGAMAGKVSGAGGGGFIMLLVEPNNRTRIINALNMHGGQASPVHLTSRGSETWIVPART
jgi:D-glycero-alpha-D-manno-heptose-7-phosphate kinase